MRQGEARHALVGPALVGPALAGHARSVCAAKCAVRPRGWCACGVCVPWRAGCHVPHVRAMRSRLVRVAFACGQLGGAGAHVCTGRARHSKEPKKRTSAKLPT